MNVNGQRFRTIWVHDGNQSVQIIDQTRLPHEFVIRDLRRVEDMAEAIQSMRVRGAILIGAAAAYGMVLAARQALASEKLDFEGYLRKCGERLKATRPTAVNLAWAVDRILAAIPKDGSHEAKANAVAAAAAGLAAEEEKRCRQIGEQGLALIAEISRRQPGKTVNILTHCNAGWLACVDYGSATAPIYAAFEQGLPIHVWVDETRPWNQGARLTAWELGQHGVPHTLIADNTGGHLMQHGLVDMVVVGADRVTRTGDTANKIGTYLKALAAHDNRVPFYVALPSSTFDWTMRDGVREIPIEERDAAEVKYLNGLCDGLVQRVLLAPETTPAANYGFDVTPARLITGLITERGVCRADETGILELFPEHKEL